MKRTRGTRAGASLLYDQISFCLVVRSRPPSLALVERGRLGSRGLCELRRAEGRSGQPCSWSFFHSIVSSDCGKRDRVLVDQLQRQRLGWPRLTFGLPSLPSLRYTRKYPQSYSKIRRIPASVAVVAQKPSGSPSREWPNCGSSVGN